MSRPELAIALRRALRPPLREARFRVIQVMVVVIAAAHLLADLHPSVETADFPGGLPVALLIVPVTYAALRYGLAGSAATGLWATLLWLPDLLLPHGEGHTYADVINLALVDLVAFIVGQRIEAERATVQRLAVEARYRQLFAVNRAPILVLSPDGVVADANPAAVALFGGGITARRGRDLVGIDLAPGTGAHRVFRAPNGRHYRLAAATLPAGGREEPLTQVVLEDVTEGRLATQYARLVVAAQEDERRRVARELHDEPLQFLHLGRRLESLALLPGLPEGVAGKLTGTRRQSLEAAARLRALARDLRPPALDQLGLAPALSGLLADLAGEGGPAADLQVEGAAVRLAPEVELGAFRIIQEAVRNTLRHARARSLVVAVRFGPGELALRAADDGRGFAPGDAAELAPGHLGMLGMAERARLLGGHLDVRSAPGQGTVVEAVLPSGVWEHRDRVRHG